ncbi:3-dehydroquinate dehydratase [Bacteroidaceae bacterium]|jgi:3-dehydroquinate dehydratase-2|uniref:type II 3-dehydroquinate dehydratase n=1 Tax=Prevotella sp. MGM2 TaxID=2033406 RepID=UPI000CEA5072|nr:type II 3-dehydroquinate dehydratase [Prevotella sp. MGM2]GAY31360.1 type II 3-dehydroquinate dehydratase [Prevotella sp. MGM2]GFI35372.1 3-dehydroquinate dehydratase [Bacteroidaceae bacterium]
MKILIMNGPNLNLLGSREPGIYGAGTMDDCLESLRSRYPHIELLYFQSNVEGFLIDRLQEAAREGVDGVVLNAGAYTHTSVALHDAIRSIHVPVVEIHISNVHTREDFRRHSVIAPACRGVICGFGLGSYRLGLEALIG